MTTYFAEPGPQNTEETLRLALAFARNKGVSDIVVATTSGSTPQHLLAFAKEFNIVVVSHAYGFKAPGESELPATVRRELVSGGLQVLTATHILAGIDRGISSKFQGWQPADLVADSLRLIGHGTKVAVEIAVAALDAGLIPYGKSVVSIGGRKSGADTALEVVPAHAVKFFDTHIREFIARPI